MADLNYEVPDELAAAFKKFCDTEALTQRVAIRWALHQLMKIGLSERRIWIDQYGAWLAHGSNEPPISEDQLGKDDAPATTPRGVKKTPSKMKQTGT